MMDIVEEAELSKKKVCEILKLNRSRYYRWKSRYEEHGFAGLKDKKPTPNGPVHSLLDEEKEAIIEHALDNPDTRHRKLAYELQNEDIVHVSPSSVYRVLKAEGLINERNEPKQDTSADGKIEVEKPNKMWHLDITYIPIKDIHAYQITVLDGCSRLAVHSELSRTMQADDIERVMSRALFKEDLFEADEDDRPVLVTDNGSQILSHSFQDFLKEWNIKHIRTAVRHPESNGKIEVFHKTIKYENIYVQKRYENFYEAQEDLDEFIEKYNNDRLHQGIDYVTPQEKHSGKAEKIVKEREKKHKQAIARRKRLNREAKAQAA